MSSKGKPLPLCKKEARIKKLESIMPEQFLPAIEERIIELEQVLKSKHAAVKNAPSGLVRIAVKKGQFQFYKRESPSDIQGRYIPRSQNALAYSLVQNDYDLKAISALEEEIKFLKQFQKLYQTKSVDKVYQKLATPRKQIVKPVTLTDSQYAAVWLKVDYRKKKIPPELPPLFTENGEQVRSKSEVIIANALKAAGVPYRYEFPLLMDKNAEIPDFPDYDFCKLHPDFYCLNLRTRKEFAWEHFGMMDDLDYATRAAEKIQLYQENGFFPGTNLIITIETSKKPLSSKVLKSIIKQYLK